MRRIVIVGTSLAVALALPASARAADHLLKVNEVMLSAGGSPAAQFVELLDPFNEPFPSPPYKLVVFDADGNRLGAHELGGDASIIDNNVPMLISTPAADAALGVTGDQTLSVALPTAAGQISYTRGPTEQKIHTLTWGCIKTPVSSSADAGPAPPDAQSAQRQADGSVTLGAPTPKANSTGAAAESCAKSPPGTVLPPGTGAPGLGTPDRVAPKVGISRRALRLSPRGVVRVRLSCPRSELSGCAGTLRIQIVKKVRLARARKLTLGTAKFKMPGARVVGVKVRLSIKKQRLVRRLKRLSVRTTVRARDSAGNTARSSVVLKLAAPRAR